MELTPQAVLGALAPALRLDGELISGWRLWDTFWLDEGVGLEATRATDTMLLEVRVAAGPRAGVGRVPTVAVAHRRDRHCRLSGDPQAAEQACRRLEGAIGELPWTSSSRRFTPAMRVGTPVDPARLAEEGPLLRGGLRAWERRLGAPARVLRVGEGAHAVAFPDVSETATLPTGYWWHAPRSFLERRTFREYLARLGYCADSDGFVRTVPTPASLLRLAQGQGMPPPPLQPALVQTRRPSLPARDWLAWVLRGVLPINVLRPRWLPLYLATGRTPLRRIDLGLQITDLGELGHDMGVHVLATHRVPGDRMEEIRARVRRVVPGASRRGLRALVALFEGDVTRFCQDLWQGLDAPHEFEGVFEARRAELDAQIEQRLAQARRR